MGPLRFTAVVEDVREECEKFGRVKQIVIPRKCNVEKREDRKIDIQLDLSALNAQSGALISMDSSSPDSPSPQQAFQQQLQKLQQQVFV